MSNDSTDNNTDNDHENFLDSQNPYEVLGIPRNASEDDIKRAYKKLALYYHPDKYDGPDGHEKFVKISNAYNKLIKESSSSSTFSFSTSTSSSTSSNTDPEFAEVFSAFSKAFGAFSAFGTPNNHAKQKINTVLELSLEQMYNGGIFDVNYTKLQATGGTKMIQKQMGPFFVNQLVPEMVEVQCTTKAFVQHSYKPESGPIIVTNPEMELYISVIEKKHEIFTRIDDNIFITVPVTLKEALTGFEKSIKTLDDSEIKLECKSVVSPQTEKIVRNYGYTDAGFMIIKFDIIFPNDLSDYVKEELSKLLDP
jgi:DnaJ-class molecular chaperone